MFVLPSWAEGVPKVTQEAAACGLAQVVFGFYEAPTVVDGVNGVLAWSDDEFVERVGQLVDDRSMAEAMGLRGAELAAQWDWDSLAPRWERCVLEAVGQ